MALWSESRNGPVSNFKSCCDPILVWIIRAASKKFTWELMTFSLCDITFMYDHRY